MLLLGVLHGVELVDAGAVVGGVPPEGDVQILQEQVHAYVHGQGQAHTEQDSLELHEILVALLSFAIFYEYYFEAY